MKSTFCCARNLHVLGILALLLLLSPFTLYSQCSSRFNLSFDDVNQATSYGFDDKTVVALPSGHPLGASVELGQLRQWTACKVFEYLESIIDIGQSSPSILFEKSITTGSQLASAYPSFKSGEQASSRFIGGDLYDCIVRKDPTVITHHGFVEVNFGQTYNDDYYSHSTGMFDLYTVLLHEVLHAMGFFSAIGPIGQSTYTNTYQGAYTIFDKYLYHHYSSTQHVKLVTQHNQTSLSYTGLSTFPTAGKIYFHHPFYNKSYPIFSPASGFMPGSSMSHLDKSRTQKVDLMNYETTGGEVRELSAEEIEILCALGYTIKGSKTTYPYGCGLDQPPIAVDDSYAINTNNKTCFNILANDYDADNDALVADLSFGVNGVTKLNGGNYSAFLDPNSQLCVIPDPNYCGVITLQYRIKDKISGRKGSVATVTISQNLPCDYNFKEPCNYVLNGGFEEGIDAYAMSYNKVWSNPEEMSGNQPTYVDHWFGVSGNLFDKACTNGKQGIPFNFFAYPLCHPSGVDVRPTSSVNNNRYAGIYTGTGSLERISTRLAIRGATLTPNKPYLIELWVNGSQNTQLVNAFPQPFNIYISNSPNLEAANTQYLLLNSTPLTAPPGVWTKRSVVFQLPNTGPTNLIYLHIIGVKNSGQNNIGYIFIDDVSVRDAGVAYALEVTTDNLTPERGNFYHYNVKVCNNGTSSATIPQITLLGNLPGDLIASPGFPGGGNQYTFNTPFTPGECRTVQYQVEVSANALECQAHTVTFDILSPQNGKCNKSAGAATVEIRKPCGCTPPPINRFEVVIKAGQQVNLSWYSMCNAFNLGWWNLSNNTYLQNTTVTPLKNTVYRNLQVDGNICECITEVSVVIEEEVIRKEYNVNECGVISISPDCKGLSYKWETPEGTFSTKVDYLTVSPMDRTVYKVTTLKSDSSLCVTFIIVNVLKLSSDYTHTFNTTINHGLRKPVTSLIRTVGIKQIAGNGSIVLSSFRQKDANAANTTIEGIALTRLDEGGGVLWSKRYFMYLPEIGNKLVPYNFTVENGNITVVSSGKQSIVLHQMNSDGDVVWSVIHKLKYGDKLKPFSLTPKLNAANHVTGYIIGGEVSGISFTGASFIQPYVGMFDNAGNKLWEKVIYSTNFFYPDLHKMGHIERVSDIALSKTPGGELDGFVLLINSGYDCGLLKMDFNGTIISPFRFVSFNNIGQWNKPVEFTGKSVVQANDRNGFVVVGYTCDVDKVFSSASVMFDASLRHQFIKLIVHRVYDNGIFIPYDIINKPDGSGYTVGLINFDLDVPANVLRSFPVLQHWDNNLAIKYTKRDFHQKDIHQIGSQHPLTFLLNIAWDQYKAIDIDRNKNYLISQIVNDRLYVNRADPSITFDILPCFDESEMTIDTELEYTAYDANDFPIVNNYVTEKMDDIQTHIKEYGLRGNCCSVGSDIEFGNQSDISYNFDWFANMDDSGDGQGSDLPPVEPDKFGDGKITTSSGIKGSSISNTLAAGAYPVPFSGYVMITLNKHIGIIKEVKLVDVIGKHCSSYNGNGTNELRIDTDGLSSGTYYAEVLDSNGNKHLLKLIRH